MKQHIMWLVAHAPSSLAIFAQTPSRSPLPSHSPTAVVGGSSAPYLILGLVIGLGLGATVLSLVLQRRR